MALWLSLLTYVAIGVAVARNLAPSPTNPELFIPDARRFIAPEPGERRLYLLGLLCIPILPTTFYWLLSRGKVAAVFSRSPRPRLVAAGHALLVGGIATWLGLLATHSQIPAIGLYLIGALVLAAGLPWWIRIRCRRGRYLFPAIIASLLAGTAYLLVVNEDVYLRHVNVANHFDLLLGAVSQVADGRTVLVNLTSQYGIVYPYICAWLLAPFGVTVTSLSVLFSLLYGLSLTFLYLAICRKVSYASPLSVLFMVVCLGLSQFCITGLFGFNCYPVYYQYFPVRFLFGSYFLWFTNSAFRGRNTWPLVVGYVVAGLSVLWNTDTGIVILAAWSGTLAFGDASAPRSYRRRAANAALHGIYATLTVILSMAGYAWFAWMRSGKWPEMVRFYEFQRYFYANGFFLLPMNPMEFWQPIMLVYLVTIFACMRRLLQGRVDSEVKWHLFIALYGAGVFSYYQGRSHIMCLPPVTYPAFLLACFFFADLLPRCRGKGLREVFLCPAPRWAFLQLTGWSLFVFFGILNFCRCLPQAVTYVRGVNRPPPIAAQAVPYFRELQKCVSGSKTIILSPISAYLHLKTNSRSALPFSSCGEVFLLSQIAEIQELVDRGECRYIILHNALSGAVIARHLCWNRYHVLRRVGDIVVLQRIEEL